MNLKPGWLGRQFKRVNDDVAIWPPWMKREAGFMDETNPLTHTRSCPMLTPLSDERCTCGLEYRIALATEQEMHAAWRKRAEEAEAELLNLRTLK
jgi:hypothetical protein